jgi:hypothetical protein
MHKRAFFGACAMGYLRNTILVAAALATTDLYAATPRTEPGLEQRIEQSVPCRPRPQGYAKFNVEAILPDEVRVPKPKVTYFKR